MLLVHTSFIKTLSLILRNGIVVCVGTMMMASFVWRKSRIVSNHIVGTWGTFIPGVSHGGFCVPATRWYQAYAMVMVL